MTNKLKCPFCGEELEPTSGYGIGLYSCPNLTCHEAPGYAEDGVWQALIQAKQDLGIARKALEEIDWCAQDYAKAQETIEQIEHKE